MTEATKKRIRPYLPVIFILWAQKIIGLKKYLGVFKYVSDYQRFRSLAKDGGRFAKPRLKNIYPILGEDTADTGFDRHYTYHPAWAARVIAKNKPEHHVDISSILAFSTLVSAFVPTTFYDYRPANVHLPNLDCKRADLLGLPFQDNEIQSLSCMHVIEHVGLGRYGDPLDPDADKKAMSELQRVLAPGGSLLFVTPVGAPKIFFNAHRVYAYDQIVSQFQGLELVEFALIPREADGDLLINPDKKITDSQTYGCGCFWFKKPAA